MPRAVSARRRTRETYQRRLQALSVEFRQKAERIARECNKPVKIVYRDLRLTAQVRSKKREVTPWLWHLKLHKDSLRRAQGKASTFDSFVKEAGATYNQVDARRKLEEAERSGALAEYNIERDATYIGPALVAKKAWDSLQEISAALETLQMNTGWETILVGTRGNAEDSYEKFPRRERERYKLGDNDIANLNRQQAKGLFVELLSKALISTIGRNYNGAVATMQYNKWTWLAERHSIKLVGWPSNVAFLAPTNLKVEDSRLLLKAIAARKLKFVKMASDDDFEGDVQESERREAYERRNGGGDASDGDDVDVDVDYSPNGTQGGREAGGRGPGDEQDGATTGVSGSGGSGDGSGGGSGSGDSNGQTGMDVDSATGGQTAGTGLDDTGGLGAASGTGTMDVS